MATISTTELQQKADLDLSIISQRELGIGTKVLRQLAPFFISISNIIEDLKYVVDPKNGTGVVTPKFAKSSFSTIAKDKTLISLEERTYASKLDRRDVLQNQMEVEEMAIRTATYPVAESLSKELGDLLTTAGNYVVAREYDVDAGGTPANAWTAAATCAPLANIRSAFELFRVSARVSESDPNNILVISPYLANLIIVSTEYITEAGTRPQPIFVREKLEWILGRKVVLTEGWFFGENGDEVFDPNTTCYWIYVDPEVGGDYTNVTRFRSNNSTFITGIENLFLPFESPFAQPVISLPEEEIRLSSNIIAAWTYSGPDGVTEKNFKALMSATVFIHRLDRLVRLYDIVLFNLIIREFFLAL